MELGEVVSTLKALREEIGTGSFADVVSTNFDEIDKTDLMKIIQELEYAMFENVSESDFESILDYAIANLEKPQKY